MLFGPDVTLRDHFTPTGQKWLSVVAGLATHAMHDVNNLEEYNQKAWRVIQSATRHGLLLRDEVRPTYRCGMPQAPREVLHLVWDRALNASAKAVAMPGARPRRYEQFGFARD